MSAIAKTNQYRSSPAQSRAGDGDNQNGVKYTKEHKNSCWEKIKACWSCCCPCCCPCCCTNQDTNAPRIGKVKRMDSTVGALPKFGPPNPKNTEETDIGRNHQSSVTFNQQSMSSALPSNHHNVSFADQSIQDGDLPSAYESAIRPTTLNSERHANGADGGDLPSTFESTNSAPAHKAPPPSPTSKSKSRVNGEEFPSTHDTGPENPPSPKSKSIGPVNPHSECEEE